MLIDRLKTSAILISAGLALVYMDHQYAFAGAEGFWLLPLLLFAAFGTARDLADLLSASGRGFNDNATIAATIFVTLSACVPMLWVFSSSEYPVDCPVGRIGWIVIAAVAAMFWIFMWEMRTYALAQPKSPKQSAGDSADAPTIASENETIKSRTIERTCVGVFVSLYVGLPMALLVALRAMNAPTHGASWGLAALLTTIIVTKSTDAGAYFTGKAFGRHKLVPRLSPGKTIEGAIGGITTATIVAFLCLKWLFPWFAGPTPDDAPPPSIALLASPFWGAIALGPILAVSGMIGDLAESLVKRDSGAKDSGNLLPGLGGVWDVTDSLIAAVMPAFLCFAAGVGG